MYVTTFEMHCSFIFIFFYLLSDQAKNLVLAKKLCGKENRPTSTLEQNNGKGNKKAHGKAFPYLFFLFFFSFNLVNKFLLDF